MRVLVLSLLAVAVLGQNACGGSSARALAWEAPASRRDSIEATRMVLLGAVRQVDSIARVRGEMPARWDIPERPAIPTDIWGRSLRFTSTETEFQLLSLGSDGVMGTEDDLVVSGRPGRSVPCEMRDEYGTKRFEDVVSPCDESVPLVLPFCSVLLDLASLQAALESDPNPEDATGRRLVRFARIIEGVGRERGGLPTSLHSVPGHPRLPGWGIPDAWGSPIHYSWEGSVFTLRSFGADRIANTSDDVLVHAELGRPARCSYRIGDRVQECADPPPPC